YWHWLIKHPVEFSKNNRTPSNDPLSRPVPRGTWTTLLAILVSSNPRFATRIQPTPRNSEQHPPKKHTMLDRQILEDFRQDGRSEPFAGLVRSPVTLAARKTLPGHPDNTKPTH
ncbi:hypothetical protein, partial [Actinoplanes palleronii]|uniref:hypothetical protein n=1 Tax=Actinoplanes palleronii TaxID=113570 RepID=UPI0031D985B7